MEAKCEKFHNVYLQFVTRLSDTYPQHAGVRAALTAATSLAASLDFVPRVVQLCNRWKLMVDSNREAFATHSDAFLLSKQATSVLGDMSVHELVDDRETFSRFRDAFWKFVDKITKLADEIVAVAPPMNTETLEQEAALARHLESMGMPTLLTPDGRFGPDISRFLSATDVEASVVNIHNLIKKSGIDANVFNPFLKAVGVPTVSTGKKD